MSTFRKRRRERYEDKHLDWRDPNMPVLLQFWDNNGKRVMREVTSEQGQQAAQFRFQQQFLMGAPDWRNDPTYNLRRK